MEKTIKSKFFSEKNQFEVKKIQEQKEKITYPGSRWSIVFVLILTISTSFFLFLKNKKASWFIELKEKISRPFEYRINKQVEEELGRKWDIKVDLSDDLGFKKTLSSLLEEKQGEYGIFYFHLKTGKSVALNENDVFPAASVNKIPIMVAFYQFLEKGTIKGDEIYSLKKEDIQDYGTGSMRYQEPGKEYKLEELIELMGKQSDNTAAYVILNLIGREAVKEHLQKLGLEKTNLDDNQTTPKEMGLYLVKLYENKLVSQQSKEKIFTALINTDFEDRLSAGIPKETKIAHKIGNEVGAVNDCGIVFSHSPYVLCLLTKGVNEAEALEFIPKISLLFWEYNKRI